MALIHEKMGTILAELEPVTKGRKNDHFNYKYRGIDDALAALNPLLAKHKVFLLPCYSEAKFEGGQGAKGDQTRASLLLTLMFVAEDGSTCACVVPGEGMDKGDKSVMKALANSMKYAIYNTFCIPTEERKDSEAFSETDGGKSPAKAAKAKAPTKKRVGKAPTSDENEDSVNTEAVDMISRIEKTKTETALELLRGPVRALAVSLGTEDEYRQRLVDAYVAQKEKVSVGKE